MSTGEVKVYRLHGEVLIPIILPPEHVTVQYSASNQVHILILVEVHSTDAANTVKVIFNDMLYELLIAIILPPGHLSAF